MPAGEYWIEKSIYTLSKCSPSFTICIRSQQVPNTSRDAEIARELSQAWRVENRKRGTENRKRGTEATKDTNQTKGRKVKDIANKITKSAAKKVEKEVAKITKNRKKSPKKKSPKKKEATTKATVEKKTRKEKATTKTTKTKDGEAMKSGNKGMI